MDNDNIIESVPFRDQVAAIYLVIRDRDAEKAEYLINVHITRVPKYVIDDYSD